MKTPKKLIACVVVAVMFITTMPFSALKAQAVSALTYDSISLNDEATVDTTKTFEFIPTESGTYKFYSYDDGGLDTYGEIYDSEFNILTYDDDNGDANNFCVVYSFTVGETYYLKARPCGEATGTYKVIIEELEAATAVEISDWYHCRYGLPGMTKQLNINFHPYGCATESVSWESSNEQVATVDNEGLVSFLSAGTATITVTSENGLTDTFDVTVKDVFATITPEQSVELSNLYESESEFLKFVPSESGQYRVYATENIDDQVRFYMFDSSANELVFSEGSSDFDYDFEAGETYYIQTYFGSYHEGSYNSCRVNIAKLVPATSMSIIANSTSGYVGDWLRFSVEFAPENSISEDVEWSSSNPAVADFYYWGNLELLSAGTTTITATSENGFTDSITITVNETPVISLGEEETVDDRATFKFVPTESGTYAFYSYDNGNTDTYADIYDSEFNHLYSNDDGGEGYNFRVVCSLEAGETYYLNANNHDDEGTYKVKLIKLAAATSLSITVDAASGYVGEWLYFDVEFAPENCAPEGVIWTSSNPEVANFDEWDDLELLSVGTTTITATSENGLTDSITVTVNEIPAISLGEEKTVDTGAIFKFVPAESGTYAFYSYDNGSLDTYGTILNSSLDDLVSDDDGREGRNFRVVYTLEAGETYYLEAKPCYEDETGNYKVKVIKLAPATSMSIVAGLTSGYVGQCLSFDVEFAPENCAPEGVIWTSSNPEVANFDEWDGLELLSVGTTTITATSTNGLTDTITITVKEPQLINADTDYTVTIGDNYYTEFRYKFIPTKDGLYEFDARSGIYTIYDEDREYLGERTFTATAGKTYNISVAFEGYDAGDYTFRLKWYPSVTNLEIISLPNKMEWIEGYINTNYVGLKVKLTFSDNTTKVVDVGYESDNSVYEVDVYTEYDDNEYLRTVVECAGVTDSFVFNLIEDPVSSIELVSGSVSLIENYGGSDYGEFYYYYYSDIFPDDIKIKINYKNGSHKIVNFFDTVDGYEFGWEADQYYDHWTVDGENYITVYYRGHTTKLPVIINKNPVDHIVINNAPTREYIYGDECYGWGEYYQLYPTDFTGISFTVYYTDNTNKTFTYKDISDDNSIGGYYCDAYLNDEYAVLGENEVTFEYLGKTATYNVTVKETPVQSIELIDGPAVTQVEYGCIADLVGAKFRVTYKDTSTQIITATADNLSCDFGQYYITVNDYTLCVIPRDGSDDSARYYFSYLGVKGEDTIEIEYIEGKEIETVQFSNVTLDINGMVAKVTYTDGTSETLTFSKFMPYAGGRDHSAGFAKTEKGLMQTGVELLPEEYGKNACRVLIMDQIFYTVIGCDKDKHQYDNDSDTTCNICGAEREIYDGWTKIDGEWYYYENGSAVTNKWIEDSKGWVYLGADGAMVKSNWVLSSNGKWYYCDANGYMLTSKWSKDSKGWVYLGADGAMVTNKWLKDSKGWCYVGSNGYAVTNQWKKDSKGWIYLDSNGSMTKSKWVKDGGKWYYCDANGYMVTNKWSKDSKGWVYVGADGAMVTNKWVKDSKGWCYVGSNGYAVTNCWKKDSKGWIYLDSNGSMSKSKWVKDGGKWYYCDANGYMVANKSLKIGSKTYKFNSSGVCTNP